jgi:DNA-directed RNA polymerase sigma subunit (sigma70/sigma32)
MTLREIAPRMGVTFPRIKQIVDQGMVKISKKIKDY